MNNRLLVFIFLLIVLGFTTSCQDKDNMKTQESIETQEAVEKHIAIEKQEAMGTPSVSSVNEEFSPTKEAKESIDNIKLVLMKNFPYSIKFNEEIENKNGHIIYDLDNDGKLETLEYTTSIGEDSYGYEVIDKCVINISGISLEEKYIEDHMGEGITKIGLVDVYKDDNFTEIFITHGDLRGGLAVIYRFVDKSFVEIARVDGGIISTSGDGAIYYWGGNLYEFYDNEEFNTDLVLSYFDANKKEYVETNQIVGKIIVSDRDVIVYKSQEDVIDGAPVTEENKLNMSKGKIVKILKPNETFKVISIENGIKISTEDGAIGWIGGFHMVWD